MSFESHLDKSINIERKKNVGTNFHPVYDWDILKNVNGMINLLSESEILRDEGGVVLADYALYIETTDIKLSDRIKATVSGDLYDVFSIHDPNGRGHHYKIKMKLLPTSSGESGS